MDKQQIAINYKTPEIMWKPPEWEKSREGIMNSETISCDYKQSNAKSGNPHHSP